MIQGISLRMLRHFRDTRGAVLHMLRCDDPHFEQFGEIYFSTVHNGQVKAWHLNKRKTINLAVPVGSVRVVVYDPRPDSATRGETDVVDLGPENYQLLTIRPGVWYGFKGIAQGTSLVANCATHPFDTTEAERLPFDSAEIPFRWQDA